VPEWPDDRSEFFQYDGVLVEDSYVRMPEVPGVRFEAKSDLWKVMSGIVT